MSSMVPQSIAILSSILKEVDIETDVFDTTFYKTGLQNSNNEKKEKFLVKPFDFNDRGICTKKTDLFADFIGKVDDFQPDLIAVSFVEDTFRLGIKLLESVSDYDIPVVAGGVFCTYATDKVMKYTDIDYIIMGEGEYALKELCLSLAADKDVKDIFNLCYKDGEKWIKNSIRLPVDINRLPVPDYSIFEEKSLFRPMNGKIYKTIAIETQRGCPFSCAYCCSAANNRLYKKNTGNVFFRKKKMSVFGSELEELVKKLKPEFVYFLADVFLMMTDREFDEFCEIYSTFKLPFFMNTRAETVSEEKIKRIEQLNCIRGNIGLEHGNENFRMKTINRKIKNDEIVKAISIVGSTLISTAANNIIGFPSETRDLVFDTINLNRKIAEFCDSVSCFIFSPYHGTALRKMAIELGYLDNNTLADADTLMSTVLTMPHLTNEMLKGLQRTFSLYVRFPVSRWSDIRIAEKFTSEGNKMFSRLSEEFSNQFPIG